MKRFLKPANLPAVAVGCGFAAQILRRLLYSVGVDARGLMIPMHPLAVGLNVLTAAVLVLLAAAVWQLDGSDRYEDNFFPDKRASMGHYAGAAGIAATVLLQGPVMGGWIGKVWMVLGALAPICLAAAGSLRQRGKMPFFALYLIPCLFLAVHLVNRYQGWSGDPQLQDYGYALFGNMALMLFALHTTEFSVGIGRRRMQLGMGLAAVYLCITELALTSYPWLFLGGILWALTGLCSLTPVPKPAETEKSTEEEK